ncbi:MAG: TonB-dependent receptor [Pseudomonadota bacterium]
MQTRESQHRPLSRRAACFGVPLVAILTLPVAATAAEQESSKGIEEVVVRAHPLAANGLAQPIETLSGDELTRSLGSNVGETVGRLPGIHNAPFGQAAGRPVIHGLGGPRVKVMEDRIDSMDASVTSADHAVTIESFVVEEIEILKGPSTLLYGTGAVGGVVDMHTARIPTTQAEQPLSGRFEIRGADNADLRQGAFRLDGGSGAFAFHVDGFARDADEYDIPGFAESAAQRAAEEAEEAEETGSPGEEEEEEVRGRVEGSQLEQQGGSVGFSFVGDRAYAGVAVSFIDAEYGLPGGHGHEHEHEEGEEEEEEEEGNPILDMEQVRVDLEAGLLEPLPGFSRATLRIGFNDYEHTEFEPNGEAGTVFSNEAFEARLELMHEAVLGFEGALGVQLQNRDFAAIGEEAFVPPVETDRFGAFWVGERLLGDSQLELGVRLETVDQDPSVGSGEDFFVWATSAGINVPLDKGWRIGANVDVATRAPVAEELYSNGPHLATQSFEIGDPDLDEEGVVGLSFTLANLGERAGVSLTLYANQFSDFIYEVPTGEEEDELPVLEFRQNDADFVGIDFSAYWRPLLWDGGRFEVRTQADQVKASIDTPAGVDNSVPRLPARRVGFGLGIDHRGLSAGVDYLRVSSQSTVTDFELPTEAFEDVRLNIAYQLDVGGRPLQVFLQGRNLTDDEQRLHTSFIKDFAPLPGRTIEAGVRFSL